MNPIDWAFQQDVSATQKTLLVGLAWVADDQGVTFKGQETLAERIGEDKRWIRRYLPALAELGLITRYRRHRLNGSRTSDLIVLNMPRDEPLDLSNYSGLLGDREPGDREASGENVSDLAARIGQPSGENRTGHTSKPVDQPAGETPVDEIGLVFAEWLSATERSPAKTKLSGERRACIKRALAAHGLDDCLAAVRNIGASVEARTGYGRGTRFDDVKHALGTTERLEKWRDWMPPQPANGHGRKPSHAELMAELDAANPRLQGHQAAPIRQLSERTNT